VHLSAGLLGGLFASQVRRTRAALLLIQQIFAEPREAVSRSGRSGGQTGARKRGFLGIFHTIVHSVLRRTGTIDAAEELGRWGWSRSRASSNVARSE